MSDEDSSDTPATSATVTEGGQQVEADQMARLALDVVPFPEDPSVSLLAVRNAGASNDGYGDRALLGFEGELALFADGEETPIGGYRLSIPVLLPGEAVLYDVVDHRVAKAVLWTPEGTVVLDVASVWERKRAAREVGASSEPERVARVVAKSAEDVSKEVRRGLDELARYLGPRIAGRGQRRKPWWTRAWRWLTGQQP